MNIGGGAEDKAVDLAGFTCEGVKPTVDRAVATDIARTNMLLLPDYPLVNEEQEASYHLGPDIKIVQQAEISVVVDP